MSKFVVMAQKQVGKTTLVNKLIKNKGNICGFYTKRYLDLVDDEGLYPIYIQGINEEPTLDNDHLIGKCGNGKHYTNNDVFNDLGVKLITTNNPNDLIVMDEVGFLEMDAEKFKEKVFEVLSSNNPVLLMLKQRLDISFLSQIKENKNIEFIIMDIDNRNDVYNYLSTKI